MVDGQSFTFQQGVFLANRIQYQMLFNVADLQKIAVESLDGL